MTFHKDLSGSLSTEGDVVALYLYVKGLPDKKVAGTKGRRVNADVLVDRTEDGEIYGIEILLPKKVLEST
jgi:uncharacterized protein YuzE